MKRSDGRVDLPMPPGLNLGSFEGAEWGAMQQGARMTFTERLEWLVAMSNFGEQQRKLAEARLGRHIPDADEMKEILSASNSQKNPNQSDTNS